MGFARDDQGFHDAGGLFRRDGVRHAVAVEEHGEEHHHRKHETQRVADRVQRAGALRFAGEGRERGLNRGRVHARFGQPCGRPRAAQEGGHGSARKAGQEVLHRHGDGRPFAAVHGDQRGASVVRHAGARVRFVGLLEDFYRVAAGLQRFRAAGDRAGFVQIVDGFAFSGQVGGVIRLGRRVAEQLRHKACRQNDHKQQNRRHAEALFAHGFQIGKPKHGKELLHLLSPTFSTKISCSEGSRISNLSG